MSPFCRPARGIRGDRCPRRTGLGGSVGPAGAGCQRSARATRGLLAFLLVLAALGCSMGSSGTGADLPVGTEVGQRAPELQGLSPTGETFSLVDHAGAPVVVVFFQGAYCGLCREQLVRIQEHLPAYQHLNARIVAVTPDPPAASGELTRRLDLEFPVVTVDSATLERWGTREGGETAPRPATFVVDRGGEVVFRHVGRNAADRATDATLLTVLERVARE